MSNRWSGYVAVMAMGLMSACQIFAPAAIQQAATVRLQGSVFVPAKQIVAGYRAQAEAALVEKPAVGAVVRLYTRDSQSLSGLSDARVDGAGNFAFQQEIPEGLYLAVATLGTNTRLMAFVRLKAGQKATTVLSAASTLVANRLGRTKLKLTGLQQTEFDEIAAQARAMMLDADLPDLSPDGVSAATDTFLAGHQVVKSRIESLLSRLASEEGLGGDPTATLPVTSTPAPGASSDASTEPTARPDPLYTPVPTPAPTPISLAEWPTLSVMFELQTDSTPYWMVTEGTQYLWVTCPASNSIMRFDSARPGWSFSRPTTNLLRDRFVPGQIAVDAFVPSEPMVWVGNQRSDGTRVARYDQWGNFLGSVEVGPAPAALTVDTDPSGPRAWIGDSNGKIVVADRTGRTISTGQVSGRPFQLAGLTQVIDGRSLGYVYIATPQAFYKVQLAETQNPTMSLSADTVDLSSLPGDIRAFHATSSRVYVIKQDAGLTHGVLAQVDPKTQLIVDTWNVATTARVVGVLTDSRDRIWVATEQEVIRIAGGNMDTFHNARPMLGVFPGQFWTFWSLHEGAPQLLKRAFGG